MFPLPTRLALGMLFGASLLASSAGLPRDAGEIRVRVRPGGHYLRTEGGVGVLRLLECTPPGQDVGGETRMARGQPAVARNGLGDVLEIPADAAPPNTPVQIIRHAGRPYRWVSANAGGPVRSAALTIDLAGCAAAPAMTIVRFTGGEWEDVGGQLQGTAITAQLPHLSIYAVAGN